MVNQSFSYAAPPEKKHGKSDGRLVLPDPAIAPLWQMRGEGAEERQVIW
jgi:hypothetical protein